MSEGTLVIVVLTFFVAGQSICLFWGIPTWSVVQRPCPALLESGSDYGQLARRLRSDRSSGRTLKVSNIDHNVSSRP